MPFLHQCPPPHKHKELVLQKASVGKFTALWFTVGTLYLRKEVTRRHCLEAILQKLAEGGNLQVYSDNNKYFILGWLSV